MAVRYQSPLHVFSINDITVKFDGTTLADDISYIDLDGNVIDPIFDKDNHRMSGIDSEFGFYVTDFIGAEQKEIDGDFAEGHAGNILDEEGNVLGLSVKNAPTDLFLSGAVLGRWALGLNGSPVKAETEHYVTMQQLLSDQAYPGDTDALRQLDNDLRILDQYETDPGVLEPGPKNGFYVKELTQALQLAMDNVGSQPSAPDPIDFDRDGTNDWYKTLDVPIDYDLDGDGETEEIIVGGVDLTDDGIDNADVVDRPLNGFNGYPDPAPADLIDLIEPNESTVYSDIAYGTDYSVTLKDDGKLLYRFGTAVKKPNDIRMEVNFELPEEWTRDEDENGIADSLEGDSDGFTVTRAELVIHHDITNNPNDQVRPEDYENEGAIGRKPSYYVVKDPNASENELWVSPVDSHDARGTFLPSYFKLTADGEIDLSASGIAVYNPDGNLVGYRNEDEAGNPIGTVLRDLSLIVKTADAELNFESSDLAAGFTAAWYRTVDREPFEWSYDKYPDDPYKQVLESFRSPEEAELAGYTEDDLVSGPRWRLTPNKFGQDLPGLEVPLEPNSQPPYQKDNIKYATGEEITTTLNLLDWNGNSPFANSAGWMLVDPERLDENGDGLIDEGWSQVNGIYGEGDALPEGLITSAFSPNGVNLQQNFLDTAIYVKGDRQDSAHLYDIELVIEYESNYEGDHIGTVQKVSDLTHVEQTIFYEGGVVHDSPVVFANPATREGRQPASITISEVSEDSVKLAVEEPNYLDGRHKPEDVGLLTLEEGSWSLADGTTIEVGLLDVAAGRTNQFHTVTFDQEFEDIPVVLAQLQTNNGVDWAILRTDNVTTTSFDFVIQEEEASDRRHEAEVLGWAAIDADSSSGLIEADGVVAQTFSLVDSVNHRGDTFTFDEALGSDPLISAMISTVNGRNPAVLRLQDLTSEDEMATAEFVVQEEQSADTETWHVRETVSGIAFEESGQLYGEETPPDVIV